MWPHSRQALHCTHFFFVCPGWLQAEHTPGLWAGAIMMGGCPGPPCFVPLKAKMASAAFWCRTLTKATEGLEAERLTVMAVMQATTMPRPRRKSPTLSGVHQSGMPVTARRISRSVMSAEAWVWPHCSGSSSGSHSSCVVRLAGRVEPDLPTVVQGVVGSGVRGPTGVMGVPAPGAAAGGCGVCGGGATGGTTT